MRFTEIEMARALSFEKSESVHGRGPAAARTCNGVDNHKALRCEREAERKFIVVEHDGAEHRIEFDTLLCAVGRVPRLTGYGLEALGIETGPYGDH